MVMWFLKKFLYVITIVGRAFPRAELSQGRLFPEGVFL